MSIMITLQSRAGNYIVFQDEAYSYFAGNNYLGLASHPELVSSASYAIEKYGINFSASRHTTGTSDIHLELESLLADFKDQQEAVVFSTGYMGNSLLFYAFKDRYSIIFADSSVHPSVCDTIPKGIPFRFYNHCDPDHLKKLLKKKRRSRPLIITDGIFALTGEIAPLDQLYSLSEKYGALLIVDDAHATGILGKNGKGTPEHFDLDNAPNLYQSETMSKALGAYGGFIAAEKNIIQKIRSGSTFYKASTALPPPIVAAGCASVRLIKKYSNLREKLKENARLIREGITEMGFITTADPTPIIPVLFKDREKAKELSEYLEKNHIIAPCVDYPVEKRDFIIRITVSSLHTRKQIENLLFNMKEWRDKHGTGNN